MTPESVALYLIERSRPVCGMAVQYFVEPFERGDPNSFEKAIRMLLRNMGNAILYGKAMTVQGPNGTMLYYFQGITETLGRTPELSDLQNFELRDEILFHVSGNVSEISFVGCGIDLRYLGDDVNRFAGTL